MSRNIGLVSLDGLEGLTSIPVFVGIDRNPVLTSLGALGNVSGSTGGLFVVDCPALVTLAGLEGITELDDELEISGNTVLVDVTALYGITRVAEDVTLVDNPVLTDAAAQALVDEIDTIGGSIVVAGNGP